MLPKLSVGGKFESKNIPNCSTNSEAIGNEQSTLFGRPPVSQNSKLPDVCWPTILASPELPTSEARP